MERYEDFEWDLAIDNLDFAVSNLRNIFNKKYEGPHRTYASNLNSATRFIHLRVWDELESIKRVREELIPLLKKADDTLRDGDEYTKDVKAEHVKNCIKLRIKNLERYCQGLSSQMIPPKEEKRLSKLVS